MPPATPSAEPRVALVTGAARGLGAAIAQALRRSGCIVVFSDIDQSVATTAGASGDHHEILDVRDRSAFETAIGRVVARFGRLDILVNNAALTRNRSVWDITPDEWDDVMAVNLRGVLFGCQIAGRLMQAQGAGRIVNLASYAGQHPSAASGAHYAASKAGIIMLTRSFAAELAPSGVTVNAVAPSAIRGPLLAALAPQRQSDLLAAIPMRRFGEPDEVGAAVLYLVSDGAGYVTGTTIDVNGGRGMR